MKKEKQNIESQIRDYIASNLNIIEPNLELIEVEYYLKNSDASSGFIDILAQDEFNQFVVIEIKRSNSASRSAANEIFKYLNLLKQNFKINDSDVRFILISTVWNELLTPFSELYHQANISIIGYQIDWENNQIIGKKHIEPLKKTLNRIFSPVQMVYLYKEMNFRFERGADNLKKCLSDIGLNNYAILYLSNDKSKNKNIIYPFALYFVFLRLTENEYFGLLTEEQKSEVLEYRTQIEGESNFQNQYLYHIESQVMSRITTTTDTAEYGYPEKLDSIIAQDWQIFNIHKNGVLKEDPRINESAIVSEIRGEKGLNTGRYRNKTKKSYRSRFEEIKINCLNCLSDNEAWYDIVSKILLYVQTKEGEQEITVNIYNPPSILFGIYQFISKHDIDYLPTFLIEVMDSRNNTLEIFTGKTCWNGHIKELEDFLDKLADDKAFDLMLTLSTNHLRNETINTFGLEFETFYNKNVLKESLETLVRQNRIDSEWDRIKFDTNNKPLIIESNNYDFEYFISKNTSIMQYLVHLINENSLFC